LSTAWPWLIAQHPAARGELNQAIGRSRGGRTTKIHALVDADGLPIGLTLTEGQAHDGRSAAPMLSGLGPGQTLLADPTTATHCAKPPNHGGSRRLGQCQAAREAGEQASLQPLPVSLQDSRRALLQQAQALQSRRHLLRKARLKLPRLIKLAATRIWLRAYEWVTY
jgi:transposase